MPVKENGKLVIRVPILHRDAKDFAALTGQILDEKGQPIPGPRVGLWAPETPPEPGESHFKAITDREGRYRLRDIPRRRSTASRSSCDSR